MDTIKENIEMLEKAPEIQKQWKPSVGDWFLNDYRGTTGFDKETENKIWGDSPDVWEIIQCLTYKPSIKEYVTISDVDSGMTRTSTMSEFFKHRHVWLPRQDQLQDMLKDCFVDSYPRKLVLCLWEWIAKTSPQYDDSMEKLWLAFVMHEKYNKKWNGTDWAVE